MKRNLKEIYYCLYKERRMLLDEDENETSEYEIIYEEPVKLMCNVSLATGYSQAEVFGNLDSYDKVVVTDDINCPIDENTVLYIDSEPNGNNKFDYTVCRVAKSLNAISYAVSKVTVS